MSRFPHHVLSGAALPARVRDLRNPPEQLYVHGELPRGASVAIVGRREPSPSAYAYAGELAAALAREGVCVLSGGARGIDEAAHSGALAARGTTLVIAPSGLESPSPKSHAELFERAITMGGGYVSLCPPSERVYRWSFFARNRVLAALAHVLVVVEAGYESGARNAAKHARELGRPIYVCAAPPWHERGIGCTEELLLGARPLVSHKDVLRALAAERAHPMALPRTLPLFANRSAERPASAAPEGKPGDDRETVLRAVQNGATDAESICVRTGLPVPRVQELVLTLTLDGVLVPDSVGRLSVRTKRNH